MKSRFANDSGRVRRARDGWDSPRRTRAGSREKRRLLAAAERRDSRRLAVHVDRERRRSKSRRAHRRRTARWPSIGRSPPAEMAGARVIDLRDDQYVLPGFFDVHAHYNMTLGANGVRSDEYTYNPLIFLANGVTSTFPAGEYDPEGMMAARQRIDAGEQIGPTDLQLRSVLRHGAARVESERHRRRHLSRRRRVGREGRARVQGKGHRAAASARARSSGRTSTVSRSRRISSPVRGTPPTRATRFSWASIASSTSSAATSSIRTRRRTRSGRRSIPRPNRSRTSSRCSSRGT